MKALDFVELALVIKGHGIDTAGSCVADVRCHLGRVGEDDAAGVHAQVGDFGDLRLGGTVKASAQCGQHCQHKLTIVALHRYNTIRPNKYLFCKISINLL